MFFWKGDQMRTLLYFLLICVSLITVLAFINQESTNDSLARQILNEDISVISEKAESGDVNYQFALGNFYMNGIKVNKDVSRAVSWYATAAGNGSADSAFNLGIYYLDLSPKDAIKWFVEASELGHKDGAYNAAVMFSGAGNKIPKDDGLAEHYYLESIKLGRSESHLDLGILYLEEERDVLNYNKAFKHLSRKELSENHEALFHLGFLYLKGHGVDKNIRTAAQLLHKSATLGNQKAKSFINSIPKK